MLGIITNCRRYRPDLCFDISLSEFLIAPPFLVKAQRDRYTLIKEFLAPVHFIYKGDVVQMITEPCLIETLKDVRELCKILRHQVRYYGPFVVKFEVEQ